MIFTYEDFYITRPVEGKYIDMALIASGAISIEPFMVAELDTGVEIPHVYDEESRIIYFSKTQQREKKIVVTYDCVYSLSDEEWQGFSSKITEYKELDRSWQIE